MNLDQEFHSFGVSEVLRRQAILVHNHRTGMALDVLERFDALQIRVCTMSFCRNRIDPGAFWPKPVFRAAPILLYEKTKALIEHDRILRGEERG